MMVDISIVIPAKYESSLTKKVLCSKNSKIWSANWDRASYLYKNPDCGYNNLTPNPKWVDEMKESKKENKLLKEKLDEYKKR